MNWSSELAATHGLLSGQLTVQDVGAQAEESALSRDIAELTAEFKGKLKIENEDKMSRLSDYRAFWAKTLATALKATVQVKAGDGLIETSRSRAWTKLGIGACGVVFAYYNCRGIIKLQKDPSLSVEHEFHQHQKIYGSLRRFPVGSLRMPAAQELLVSPPVHEVFLSEDGIDGESTRSEPSEESEGGFWLEKTAELMAAARLYVAFPTSGIFADRILPLRKTIRDCLINLYCPPHLKGLAEVDEANAACLIRPYLGRATGKPRQGRFCLNNFELHIEEMVTLGLDIQSLANSMGQALAVMHWAARTDARGVEFVLGSTRFTRPTHSKQASFSDANEEHWEPHNSARKTIDPYWVRTDLYLLDVNLVRDITLDEEGIEMAVKAHKASDPYYPRPGQTSAAGALAWDAFVKGYLDSAARVLCTSTKVERLAIRFLTRVKEECSEET